MNFEGSLTEFETLEDVAGDVQTFNVGALEHLRKSSRLFVLSHFGFLG